MLIDTVNSEEMMAGSHITEFHRHEQEEPVTTELLNKVSHVQEVTHKHYAGGGNHNQSDPKSTTSADCKLPTRKGDMISELSYLEAPTSTKDSNETSNENRMGDLKPADVDKNNNDCVKRANTGLEPNNIPGAHVLEQKEEWFYQLADNYDVWNNDSCTLTKGNEVGGSHTFTGDTGVFNPTKTKHNRKLKTRIVNEVSTSNNSDFYISIRQS